MDQGAALALHAHTALPLAHATPMSDVNDFFGSNEFDAFRKTIEGRQRLAMAYIERMDGLSKQLGGVGNAVVKAVVRVIRH